MWPVAYGPHWPRLPPPASPAPISLVCPHGEEDGSALVLGIGLWLWQSALGFPSLSFIYKSIVFPSLWIDRQFIIFSSSPSSSRVNTSSPWWCGLSHTLEPHWGSLWLRSPVPSPLVSSAALLCRLTSTAWTLSLTQVSLSSTSPTPLSTVISDVLMMSLYCIGNFCLGF